MEAVSAPIVFGSHESADDAVATARSFIGSCPRVVVCAPHPDDEVLGCGGLLAMCAAEGIPTVVVSVTDGEACYPNHAVWTRPKLRAARRKELRQALDVLGLPPRTIRRLALPDGAVATRLTELVEALHRIVRTDDAVFVTARFDGHPDHEACAQAARQVADTRGNRLWQYPIWAGHLTPLDATAWQGLVQRDLVLPEQARRRKEAAIACFATQTGGVALGDIEPVLPPSVCARFQLGAETFYQ